MKRKAKGGVIASFFCLENSIEVHRMKRMREMKEKAVNWRDHGGSEQEKTTEGEKEISEGDEEKLAAR